MKGDCNDREGDERREEILENKRQNTDEKRWCFWREKTEENKEEGWKRMVLKKGEVVSYYTCIDLYLNT